MRSVNLTEQHGHLWHQPVIAFIVREGPLRAQPLLRWQSAGAGKKGGADKVLGQLK